MSPSRRRRLPPRAVDAAGYLQGFVLAGVATVLATRAYLLATGYPQLGGGGLHLAHVLWGGLLMALGLGVALVFLGGTARMTGAIVGGIGFGLFIDEVGKFVTAETDYFYRPAASIIYAVFALLVVITQAVRDRMTLTSGERVANALDTVVGGVGRGLTDRRRVTTLRMVRGAGPEVEYAVSQLLDAVPRREPPPRRFWQPWLAWLRTWAVRVITARWVVALVVMYLVAEPVTNVVSVVVDGVTGRLDEAREWGALLGVSAAALVAAVLGIRAAFLLRPDRAGAFRLFKLALLVNLLFGQVFNFTVNQFGAVATLALDLFLLAVVTGEHRRVRAQTG
ncbi:hypothetical protein [Micromonospora sp. KC213]|uniref:hypothetical protein n=1 Tax=Micromonospora sp. KC213 TaxID=2530378 RepID=UPI00104A9780|nr:hypothetical protein [Micromonospora sp. KC213]TDC34720.1 hypothetical protein E1166_24425 [Micromonospora sp. KC213]